MKRRKSKMLAHRITIEAVTAFRSGDETALHRALGLKPWQVSPLAVETAPGEGDGTGWGHSFVLARELRAALVATG